MRDRPDDARERGLDRYNVTLAAIVSCGLAIPIAVASLKLGPFTNDKAVRSPTLVLGLAVGIFLALLGLSAARPTRSFGRGIKALCALSGIAAGVLWPFLLRM
jgi:hypothetical protein